MEQKLPTLSVVMAVYNGEQHLMAALDSILAQTCSDFECVIIDDASTDATPRLLQEYAARDKRLRVYRNEQNLRLAASLNRGVALARGQYIVRTDADDICMPDRFEKQLSFMREHPSVGVSYCKFFTLCEGTLTPCGMGSRCDADSVRARFLFFNPVLHPGVIARREVMRHFAYDPARTCSEDMDLWMRMLTSGVEIVCQNDYLMLYRLHVASISASTKGRQAKEVTDLERAFYEKHLFLPTAEQMAFFIDYIYFPVACDLRGVHAFYREIMAANRRTRFVPARYITYAVMDILAGLRRTFSFNKRETLYLLRFGGLRFAAEFLRRKRRAAVDCKAAARALSCHREVRDNG